MSKRSEAAKKGWETRRRKAAAAKAKSPAKAQKPKASKSSAAKKGWETRRKRAQLRQTMQTRELSMAERAFLYPKVQRAIFRATKIQQLQLKLREEHTRIANLTGGPKPAPMTAKDKLLAELAAVSDASELQLKARRLANKYALDERQIYDIFFSPDAA